MSGVGFGYFHVGTKQVDARLFLEWDRCALIGPWARPEQRKRFKLKGLAYSRGGGHQSVEQARHHGGQMHRVRQLAVSGDDDLGREHQVAVVARADLDDLVTLRKVRGTRVDRLGLEALWQLQGEHDLQVLGVTGGRSC